MVISFELWTQKQDAAGRMPVFVVAYFDGQRLRCSTKEKCLPGQWDAQKQRFRKSFPGQAEANDALNAITERLQQRYRQLRTSGLKPTADELKLAIHPKPAAQHLPASPSVVELFDEFRHSLAGRGFRAHTIKGYGTTRNHLAAWAALLPEPLTVANYTMAAHEDFLHHLRIGAGLSQNTIAGVVKHLKPFLAWIRDTRGVTLALDPSRLSVEWEEVEKAWLTASKLTLLERALLPTSLVKVRDAFLFCCYTGLRYSDLHDLHAGNLHAWEGGTVLRLTQTKTRTSVSIYLTPPALALVAKYDGTRARLLPSTANQVMNRYLKRIARLAGIVSPMEVVEIVAGRVMKRSVEKWELVTMHTARHTFAVQSLMRGLPVVVLQKVLGHAKIQSTMVYAKVVEDFQHHEMRRVWEGGSTPSLPAADGVCAIDLAA